MQVAVAFDSGDSIAIAGADRCNLRADPQAIDRVEPARRYAALRGFLASVNASDSPFATVACKAWNATVSDAVHSNLFASRVDLIFLREAINFGRGPYEDLAARLVELLEREPGENLRLELRIMTARFAADNSGLCLRVILYAKAATPEQAAVRWGLGLARVQQAVMFAARALRQQIQAGN